MRPAYLEWQNINFYVPVKSKQFTRKDNADSDEIMAGLPPASEYEHKVGKQHYKKIVH